MFVALIAPIGIDCFKICIFRRLTTVSDIKFAVAHVSNNARHFITLCLLSLMNINALVNNCGAKCEIVVRLVDIRSDESESHLDEELVKEFSELETFDFVV